MTRWSFAAAVAFTIVVAACTGSDPVTLPENSTSSTSAAPDQIPAVEDDSVTGDETSTPNEPVSFPIVFDSPTAGIDDATLEAFIAGQGFFNEIWSPVGPTETASDGLGPLFNADSCAVCHQSTGRRQVPPEGELTNTGLVVRLSVPGVDPITGAPLPEPTYGDQLQDGGLGVADPEGTIFTNYVTQFGTYPDGTPFEIIWPTVNIRNQNYGPITEGFQVSARIGAQLVGMGLLELIPQEDILALADPTDINSDGISGRPNVVWNPQTQQNDLGRFGWKANVVELDQQVAQAFHGDLGITSSLLPIENCAPNQTACSETPSGGTFEVSDEKLEDITTYMRLLAVPPPRTEGNPEAERGEELFRDFGCASCHTESHTTGVSDIPELSEQTIFPYTDMLLHDMGFDMGDDRPDFAATGNEWRTPPLWGLGLIPVEGDRGLLHDGRARTLEEAILWHGGESIRSRNAFMAAELADRNAVLAFLESL